MTSELIFDPFCTLVRHYMFTYLKLDACLGQATLKLKDLARELWFPQLPLPTRCFAPASETFAHHFCLSQIASVAPPNSPYPRDVP